MTKVCVPIMVHCSFVDRGIIPTVQEGRRNFTTYQFCTVVGNAHVHFFVFNSAIIFHANAIIFCMNTIILCAQYLRFMEKIDVIPNVIRNIIACERSTIACARILFCTNRIHLFVFLMFGPATSFACWT